MNWKRLLLIALVAGGFAFVPVQRSDAQVSVGIGFGSPGYAIGMAGIGTTATTAITTTIGINVA